ncbi:MFS transporter [Clostridiaceae bacterium HSG29]|nr:MFS transporter [Clostridiaceae bacterium HSG29]
MEKQLKQGNKWVKLMVLILGGGTIYKLGSMKDVFYIPMQEIMGLTHTQIGIAMSVYSVVMTMGYFVSMYVADRFSKKKLIPFSLISVGFVGFYLATFPGYTGFLISYVLLALFSEMTYWPVLLKAVRLLGNENEQGRMFGFLEAGRGLIDTITAFIALWIFVQLGEGEAGFRGGLLWFSIVPMIIGVISYFMLDDDEIRDTNSKGKKVGKNIATFANIKETLTYPEVWVASFTVFFVYSVYCGLTYFIPFLSEIYGLPVALVGAYGIINQYGLKMVGGPVGGYLADKKFKSPSKYLRFAFVLSIVTMSIFMFLPHESMNVYVGMTATLGFGAIIFTQRAVFFAPMEEIGTPHRIAGSVMGLGSFIGYAPSIFCYVLYGSILDKMPGLAGYKVVWSIMIGFAILGFFTSNKLVKMISTRKEQNQEIA